MELVLLQALKIAHKPMGEVPDDAKAFMPMEGFDLGSLDDVAVEEMSEQWNGAWI